jgi:hypothetical protein
MIFDTFGGKGGKKQAEREREREKDRAWALYGKEVEAFLNNGGDTLQSEFEKLEKSKAATRPPVKTRLAREEEAPLPLDLALRVKRGEIQGSKARRFMTDKDLQPLLSGEGVPARTCAEEHPPALPLDLALRVKRGEIQGSKARRFITDKDLPL